MALQESYTAPTEPCDQQGTVPSLRVLPHNEEAEQHLLGAILNNNDGFYRICDFLLAEHFYFKPHQKIYTHLTTLIQSGKLASPVTVKTFFSHEEVIADCSAAHYLFKLAGAAGSVINLRDYAFLIRDLALRRQLVALGEEITATAYRASLEKSPQLQIEEAERSLYRLAEKGSASQGFINFAEALTKSIEMAALAYKRGGKISGIATGFQDLDRLIGGFHPSDLIIIAGRPGMGKTAFATNIAHHAAANYRSIQSESGQTKRLDGGRVGFFSLEMSAEQLATRVLSEQSELCSSRIRRGELNEAEFTKMTIAARAMQSMPLSIDQSGGISISTLVTRARRLKRQVGLDLLIVDYIQLLSGTTKTTGQNRVQEITEVTTGLKALAKELDIPVIALSQLSRKVEEREEKYPQLSDLRESGSIEQDADMVLFVYREEYYLNQRRPPEEKVEKYKAWEEEMEKARGKAEIIIAKQRHGPTGTILLQFTGNYTRFADLAPLS